MRLGDLTWPAVPAERILALPLGSTEQHGPHLPLSTDADVAAALCAALASARDDVVVAPVLPYGASGEHQDFPGTVSIGTAALTHVLVELGRSASASFSRLLVVSGHGGNLAAVRSALATLTAESRDVLAWFPRWSGDAHAGFVETSLQLYLSAERVALADAAAGAVAPLAELMPALRSGGVRSVSPNGVLGDPAGASAESGQEIFEGLAADLVTAVAAWVSRPVDRS